MAGQEAYGLPQVKELNFSTFSPPFSKIISQELLNHTNSEFRNHPELGKLPYDAPCTDCYEIIEKRTSNTRFFIKNGTEGTKFYSQASLNDMHYKNEKGEILTINPFLIPDSKNPGIYHALDQADPTTLNMNEGYTSIQLMDKSIFKFNKEITFYTSDDLIEKENFQIINRTEYSAGADGAQVYNAFNNIDQQLIYYPASIKSNYILKDISACNFDEKYLIIEDQFELPAGFTLTYDKYEGELNTFGFWYGELVVENENGIEMARFKRPIVYDSDTSDFVDPEKNNIAGYLIEQTGNNIILKQIIDIKWLTSPSRIFPIVVDPTVFGTTATWTGISGADDSPTFCNVVLSVPTPANATLTGSSIHWEYRALGGLGSCGATGCKIKHLQARICTTCDCSPTLAGVWVGVTNAGGLWIPTVDDATTADLVECFTPQCTSFNIDFTLYFNQFSCVTAGGCVTTCSYLEKFQVTIEGETVAVTALAEGLTSYTVSNCADQSGFLSASTPNYGVPGYTYSWSPIGLTGTPVYTSWPMGTTVYTLTITDACGNIATDNVTVINNCLVLPIELLSFSGYYQDNGNFLNWETGSEINNSSFVIERSPTGLNFESIGNIDGGGTTNNSNFYSFVDRDPFEGVNYYRLKQIDADEAFSYSEIIAIKASDVNSTHLIINNQDMPDDLLELTIFSTASGPADLFIYDITGKKVAANKVFVGKGATSVKLQLPELAKGAYIIAFSRETERAEAKFIK